MIHTASSKGFSLVEILLALSIIAVIAVVGVTSFSNYNTEKALSLEAEKVVSLLVKARSLSLSAKGGDVYGVHFDTDKAVLFKGTSYSAGTAGNQAQQLNSAVRISATVLAGGGAEVVFRKLTGTTAQSGTVTLALVKNGSLTKTVTITATGTAYSN